MSVVRVGRGVLGCVDHIVAVLTCVAATAQHLNQQAQQLKMSIVVRLVCVVWLARMFVHLARFVLSLALSLALSLVDRCPMTMHLLHRLCLRRCCFNERLRELLFTLLCAPSSFV